MYQTKQGCAIDYILSFPTFNRLELENKELILAYIDQYSPISCEYNFANLFAWQDTYNMSWTIYQERLLIYDGVSNCSFMPLGEVFLPEELVTLSLELKKIGLGPNISLATPEYLDRYPEISNYYKVETSQNYAEYIYDVQKLVDLTGVKLHKKKNLISQFWRSYPEVRVHTRLNRALQKKALELSRSLVHRRSRPSTTLKKELVAIETSFEHFSALELEGLALTLGDDLVAYSVVSRLNRNTYDTHFEKADPKFKGASQVINHETAKYLQNICKYLNREQDLGIKGLRQAKMSYDPVELFMPGTLVFNPAN